MIELLFQNYFENSNMLYIIFMMTENMPRSTNPGTENSVIKMNHLKLLEIVYESTNMKSKPVRTFTISIPIENVSSVII